MNITAVKLLATQATARSAATTRTAPFGAAGPYGPAAPAGSGAAALAAATPASRDRYLDFLRVLSIGVVVLGHWLMASVEVRPDGIRVGNALAGSSTAQLLTWVFQVMPVFFFVGGFAHATGMRSLEARGGRYADFVRARVSRLLAPTALFLAVWTVLAVALEVTGRQDGIGRVASRTIVQPLWFIGVYLGIVALAPLMYRWHRRHGAAVIAVLLAGAVLVDVVRFRAGVDGIGALNLAFVWLAAHQFGYLYADGTLTRHRRTGPILAVAGLTAVVLLTVVFKAYPVSMVGMPGDRVSNMSPPTVALAAHAIWLIGLVLVLRAPVTRWLDRPRVWTAVVAANGVVMTTFLWHLTALFAAYAALLAAGFTPPTVGFGRLVVEPPAVDRRARAALRRAGRAVPVGRTVPSRRRHGGRRDGGRAGDGGAQRRRARDLHDRLERPARRADDHADRGADDGRGRRWR